MNLIKVEFLNIIFNCNLIVVNMGEFNVKVLMLDVESCLIGVNMGLVML